MAIDRPDEIDFDRARNQIQKSIESYIDQHKIKLTRLPGILFENGETRFEFPLESIQKDQVFDAIALIKNHIPQLRIHTFEPGYIIFQADDPDAEGTKFRLASLGKQKKVQVSRRGNLNQDEIQICLRLFELFHSGSQTNDPGKRLSELGIPVYRRNENKSDEKNKSNEVSKSNTPMNARELGKRYGFAGYDQTKEEVLESVILPLQNPDIFYEVARLTRGTNKGVLPRAVLFEGPPGVGKTSMARIIAAETNIPLVYVPVENITSKYYGESAQNMATIFDTAAAYERVIIFLDEIDSLGLSREGGLFEASRRILSVLLRKIDGFESRNGVLTIGATNRRADLDGALLSRFDTIIHFPLPDGSERANIFKRYANHLSADELIDLGRHSKGLSGRNIQDICEYVERRRARQLLMDNQAASTPPAKLYLQITTERAAAV